jgi:hypothetical protein
MSLTNTVLLIGPVDPTVEGSRFKWSDNLNDLPTASQFGTIVVLPEANSDAQQADLAQLLAGDLELSSGTTRVVWYLNEHTCPGALTRILEPSRLVRLRHLEGGQIQSFLSEQAPTSAQVSWGVSTSNKHLSTLAYWQSAQSGARVQVAVASADDNWEFIPECIELSELSTSRTRLAKGGSVSLRLFAIATVCTILACAWAAGTYRASRRLYRSEITRLARVGTAPHMRDALARSLEAPTWVAAEAHGARRIMQSEQPGLALISARLEAPYSPHDLALRTADDPPALRALFAAAFLTGDIASAYRIAREHGREDSGEWMHTITNAFFQTSVESLMELDFPKAAAYNEIYLRLSGYVLEGNPDSPQPERIRTMSQIIHRAFVDGSVYSLCKNPAAARQLGALLGHDWGQPPPAANAPGLSTRINENRRRYCAGRPPPTRVPFESLANLIRMNNDVVDTLTRQASDSTCADFPVECTFIRIRNRLSGLAAEKARGEQAIARVSDAALQFAAVCSYLSDDMVWRLLLTAKVVPMRLSAPKLRAALACISRQWSDYSGAVESEVEEVPCSSIVWDAGQLRERLLLYDRVAERCGGSE